MTPLGRDLVSDADRTPFYLLPRSRQRLLFPFSLTRCSLLSALCFCCSQLSALCAYCSLRFALIALCSLLSARCSLRFALCALLFGGVPAPGRGCGCGRCARVPAPTLMGVVHRDSSHRGAMDHEQATADYCARHNITYSAYVTKRGNTRQMGGFLDEIRARFIGSLRHTDAPCVTPCVTPCVRPSVSAPKQTRSAWPLFTPQTERLSRTRYSPLGGLSHIDLLHSPEVLAVGKQHNKSAAQVRPSPCTPAVHLRSQGQGRPTPA